MRPFAKLLRAIEPGGKISLRLAALLLMTASAKASTQSLESSVLRLEVDTTPFAFRVIEKSTSDILLAHTNTFFSFGSVSNSASAAINIATNPLTLDADLQLTGTSAVAHVTFTFTQPDVVTAAFTTTNNASQISQKFNDQGENYYGVWEYPFGGTLNIRGTDQQFLGVGTSTAINYCSARAPFYLTSRKYGIYAQTDALGRFTMGVNGKTSFTFTNSSSLTFHIIYGTNYSEILKRYNTLAGGAFMPPKWAFSTIWWKDDDHVDYHIGVSNAQGNVLDTANKLRDYQIPASAIWIDRPYGTGVNGWGNLDFDSSFPDPAQMINDLNARGMNLMLWIANRAFNGTFLKTNGSANGYLFSGISSSTGPAADLRITNAYTWFQANLNAYVNLGIKGYKIDRGEEGEQPDSVQNQNITLFHKLAAEGQAAVHPGDNFTFTRNACDNSRKYVAIWNGDSACTFAGLQYSIISGLRSGLINFPMWGADTGGYNLGPPTEELFARWFEFSTYTPIMEVLIGNTRTPWYNYTTNLINIARSQCADHHDLIPYTRSLLYQATQTGTPAMRPLFFTCQNDSSVSNTWDEYLFGDKLLVAPVVTAGATNRNVYLPAGVWLDYNSKSGTYAGPTNLTVAAPLATIPLFVSEGAIIARGDILKANNNWTANWSPQLRVEIFPADNSNSSFDYYTGDATQTITCSSQNHTITVQFGDLGNIGNLELHVRNAGSVVRNGITLSNGVDYNYDSTQRLLVVPFTGVTTLELSNASSLFAPVEVWRTAHFGSSNNPAIADDTADPDGDHIPNYVEYAYGLNPRAAGFDGMPIGLIQTNSATNYLALKFQRSTTASDCIFTVRVSDDLIQWDDGSSYSGQNIVPSNEYTTEVSHTVTNGIESITVRDNTSLDSAPRRFITLRVTPP